MQHFHHHRLSGTGCYANSSAGQLVGMEELLRRGKSFSIQVLVRGF
jgi:hypothetical protein